MHQLVIFIFNKRVFSLFRWPTTGWANRNVCQAYDLLFHDGHCKHILGNSPVFGKTMEDLQNNEKKMSMFGLLELLKPLKISIISKRCLAAVEDIYCHYYFPRCYNSSSVQPICREACERKFLLKEHVCDQLIKAWKTLNRETLEHAFTLLRPSNLVYILNCTTLPSRNQTRNCYYPVIQG